MTWECHHCGAIFKAWAAAQRHADEAGHVRVEVTVVPCPCPCHERVAPGLIPCPSCP